MTAAPKRQSTSPNYLRRLEAADIGSLRIFCTVVEAESFSAAARILNVAISTISRHIDVLEHALERPLIQRTTRQFSITEDGKIFFDQCQVALRALSAAVEHKRAESLTSELSGRLRISAPPALSQTVIGPHLSEFLTSYPRISVELLVTASSLDLVAEGIDIAIRIDDQPSTKYASIHVGSERRLFCASPGFIEKFGVPASPTELSDFNCLVNVYTAQQQTWPIKIDGQKSSVPINGTFACNSGDIIRQLCLDGVGIGLFTYSQVRGNISDGSMIEILPESQIGTRSIYALLPHKKYVNDCAAVFLEFIQGVFEREGIR